MKREAPLLHRLRPRSVALFRASRIGDFVCATPAFRAFRAALPDAELTLIGLPLVADLAARCPSLDRFEAFPGMPGIAEQFFDARRALAFVARMQAACFDLVVQMHGSGVFSNPIALMLGGRATAGFIRPGDPPGLLDAALPMPDRTPEVGALLALASFLGASRCCDHTEFPLTPDDEEAGADALRGLPPPYIGIHPGAREAAKRWLPDRFAAAANRLAEQVRGSVLIIGSEAEIGLSREIGARVRAPHLELAGRLNLPALGAVIRRLAVLIANDSGPAHIAYALDTPTVTLFGGTDPNRWRPLAAGPFRFLTDRVACRRGGDAACLKGELRLNAITVEQVVKAALEVLGGSDE